MRLLITGGGTGGHVYPALSILEALSLNPKWNTSREDVVWVGRDNGIEARIAARENIGFCGISTGAMLGATPMQALRSIWRILIGVGQSWRLIGRFRPDAVLATGGYVSVPLVLAAWLRRCPSLIELPDMTPGLAIKFLARFATRIAVSFDTVQGSLPPEKTVVCGYPVRAAIFSRDRQAALLALGLGSEHPLVLVLGGSSGAHSINVAVLESLERLLQQTQLVHLCGQDDITDLATAAQGLPQDMQRRYHPYAYLHEEMVDALVAADLIVARAGAATLGEFPAVGAPAILVPYPHAGSHQKLNAEYMAERGAGIVVEDAQLGTLADTIINLIQDSDRRQAMADASRGMARPDAARAIAAELITLAEEKRHG